MHTRQGLEGENQMRKRLVLLVAALALTLMVSSACGGGATGNNAGNAGGGNGGVDNGGAGISDTSESGSSTGEASTGPISQICQPPDMENCFGYEDMQAYLNQI